MWSRTYTKFVGKTLQCGDKRVRVSPSKTRLVKRETRNSGVERNTSSGKSCTWRRTALGSKWKEEPREKGLSTRGHQCLGRRTKWTVSSWREFPQPQDLSVAVLRRAGSRRLFTSAVFTKIWRNSHSDLGEMDPYWRWRGQQHKATGGGEPIQLCGEEDEL